MNTVEFFSATRIEQLRKPLKFPIRSPQGWSKSQVDPMEVLKPYLTLRLKKGFVLCAYQFRSGGNGNTVVWAIPDGSPFPDPDPFPSQEDTLLEPPRPPSALDDIMDVIEGDDSFWSYLSASIFAREISEFGALWHGCSWSTHEIIDEAPPEHFNKTQEDSEKKITSPKVNEWTWIGERPNEWRPSVCRTDNKVIVTFYSFSGLGTEAIYRHIDTFQAGKYAFKTKEVMIAEGGGGYVF